MRKVLAYRWRAVWIVCMWLSTAISSRGGYKTADTLLKPETWNSRCKVLKMAHNTDLNGFAKGFAKEQGKKKILNTRKKKKQQRRYTAVTLLSHKRLLLWSGYVVKENHTGSKVTWQLSPGIFSIFISVILYLEIAKEIHSCTSFGMWQSFKVICSTLKWLIKSNIIFHPVWKITSRAWSFLECTTGLDTKDKLWKSILLVSVLYSATFPGAQCKNIYTDN